MSDRSKSVSNAIPANGNPNPAPEGMALTPVKTAVPEPPVELQEHAGQLMLQTVTLETLVDRVNLIKEAMRRCMVEGQHYGTIPGTKKPSLWKPGAELICILFQLGTRYPNHSNQVAREQGHFTFTLTCELFHIPSGRVIGEGVGACTTLEYRYRIQTEERTYPNGNTVPPKYTPFDFYNTVLKIAKKRSMVDAVLTVTGASEIFTQDLEDDPEKHQNEGEHAPARRPLSPAPPPSRLPPNGNGIGPHAAPVADWTPGRREELSGDVGRAWPNDYQGTRFFLAKLKDGRQVQTKDPVLGERLLALTGQPVRALAECSAKPGKFYLIAFGKEPAAVETPPPPALPSGNVTETPTTERVARRKAAKAKHEATAPITEPGDAIPMD